MKHKTPWLILTILGVIPFAVPFLCFAYEMLTFSSWTLVDWLLLYSFVYWPTYVIGFILLVVGVYKLRK